MQAYVLFLKMKEKRFQPGAVTYMSLPNDCASTGAVEWVKDVHRHLFEGGYESDYDDWGVCRKSVAEYTIHGGDDGAVAECGLEGQSSARQGAIAGEPPHVAPVANHWVPSRVGTRSGCGGL